MNNGLVKMVFLFALIFSFCSGYGQKNLTYQEIDSIVKSILSSDGNVSIIDTGHVKQYNFSGFYRDCSVIEKDSKRLLSFSTSMMEEKSKMSHVVIYYFHQAKLIKAEIFDITIDYKKSNLTYLYYTSGVPQEKEEVLNSREPLKLYHLRQAMSYLQSKIEAD